MPDISVVICTWNRAKLLDQTLAEMRKLDVPPGVRWELIVVNNNSTDDTDGVLGRYAGALPVRRLFEPRPGKSHAANAAVGQARGGLVVWTDDDVLVDPGWLAEYAKASRDWPDAAYFGGTVDPHFATRPPAWVPRHLDTLQVPFAMCRYGPTVRRLQPGEYAVGANMAFRTAVVRQYGFDSRFGPQGADTVGGGLEDNILQDRVVRDGGYGVWVGPARVRHYLPPARMTPRFVWKRHRDEVRLLIRRYGMPDGMTPDGHPTWAQTGRPVRADASVPHLWGAPRWMVRKDWNNRLRAWLLSPWKSSDWLEALRRSAYWRGMVETIRASRTPGNQPHPTERPPEGGGG